MAIKFQYNKTSLNDLDKQLKMRNKALPTLKSKESALRAEVKKAKDSAADYEQRLQALVRRYEYMTALWGEFDTGLLSIRDVDLEITKIAGVRIPVLREVIFEQKPYDLFSSPAWYADGIGLLKQMSQLSLEYEFFRHKTSLLDYARKKTTQKVNLYEKVQIPGYQDAIRKIKRFLEDEENLSKSSQKIVKNRQAAAAAGQGKEVAV
ncbi:MAG: V-type ATP synthase subunit D [Alistipes sp.]|nr:V-type ATP synthase subunit D [Alistipes sp.]